MKRESKIQSEILNYLKGIDDCQAVKIVAANRRGVPDIHICHKGRYIVLEVKTEIGELTTLQRVQLRSYKNAGAIAEVIRGLDEVKRIIDQL